MRPLRPRLLLLSISFLFFLAANAAAQGVIVPGPCRRCPEQPRPITLPRSLPVKSIKIDTRITSQVATTHVEQIFRNDTGATLEGIYFFPIPEQASITEFAMWEGDRRLVGEVRPLVIPGHHRRRRTAPARRADCEPRVSVVITAYNEERDLAAKLENTLALDYPEELLEVIVASDCSTDRTSDVTRGFAGVNLLTNTDKHGKLRGLRVVEVPIVFRERVAGFPVRVEVLSRFRSEAEQREIVKADFGAHVVKVFNNIQADHLLTALETGEEPPNSGEDNAAFNVFVRDVQANTTTFVSRASGAWQPVSTAMITRESICGKK